jgi:hypothetical protein
VVLRDQDPPVPDDEFLGLEYMDWKSGGDTNFAPIATADGELDCRGFWKPGDERPTRAAVDLERAALPDARRQRRVGRRRLRARARDQARAPGYEDALRQIHRDDNNRFNPDGDGWVVRRGSSSPTTRTRS